jgi:hypothetical protein
LWYKVIAKDILEGWKMVSNQNVSWEVSFEPDLNIAIDAMVSDLRQQQCEEIVYKDIDLSRAILRYMYIIGMNDAVLLQAYKDLIEGVDNKIYTFESEISKTLAEYLLARFETHSSLNFRVPLKRQIKNQLRKTFFWMALKKFIISTFRRKLMPPRVALKYPSVLCFVHQSKFVRLLRPLISELEEPAAFVVEHLTEQKILGLNDNEVVPYGNYKICFNTHLDRWSILCELVDRLEFALKKYNPRMIVVAEGDAPYHELLAALGKKHGIHSICLQWGAFTQNTPHVGFRQFGHSAFLAWGNYFIEQLRPFSPETLFLAVGNPSVEYMVSTPRKRIVFLLQGVDSVQISQEIWDVFWIFMISVIKCADDWEIIVREHPNLSLTIDEIDQLAKYPSVELHNPRNKSLTESLDSATLAVTIFSSALLDAVAMGIVPFVFNPSQAIKRYQPDLEKYDAGIDRKTLEQALVELKKLLVNTKEIEAMRHRLMTVYPTLFANIGPSARAAIVDVWRRVIQTGHPV